MRLLHHVEFDWKAADKSAEIYYQLARKGQEIDPFDCMIASVVLLQDGDALLTSNVKHFNRIPGLVLVALNDD